LIQLFTTGDVLAAPPEVHNCPIRHKKSLGQSLVVSSNPAIVLLHTTSSALEECARAAEDASRDSKGLNSVVVVEDTETKGIRTELIMDSWKSYEAFETSGAANAIIKGNESAVKIRVIAGFLGREDKSKL
jgi:hypothetical protein